MTLNITVLTKDNVFQSADNRMSTSEGKPLKETLTKHVIVVQLTWTGFITFHGIGKVGTNSTSSLVESWILGLSADTNPQTFIEVIRSRASLWINQINGVRKHSFIFAFIENGKPSVSLISNFQKIDGTEFHPTRHFSVTRKSSYGSTDVITTVAIDGNLNRLVRHKKKILVRYCNPYATNVALIRRYIAKINEDISKT